jgi:AraC-like DNA-binding protein
MLHIGKTRQYSAGTAAQRRVTEEVIGMVEALSRVSGVGITWKWFIEPESRLLPRSISNHNNVFCDAVKECTNPELCKRDDIYRFAPGNAVPRAPFLKTCHAGVTEMLVPVLRGADCVGMLYAGPVRTPKSACPCAGARRAMGELPLLDRRLLNDIAEVLGFVARRLDGSPLDTGVPAAGALDPRMAQAIRHIEQHLAEPLRAGEIARACALSPSRFMHVFSSAVGTPFSSYVVQRRMARARRLLVQSDLSIGDVGRACGYASQDYFSAAFTRTNGVSASAYRRAQARRLAP